MNKYKFRVIAGTIAVASVALAGCGSPSATFDGKDIKNLDETIESIDAMWAESRTGSTPSEVDDESRCYAQTTELALADQVICGPIHYLGDDEQVWESITLSFSASDEKRTSASPEGPFSIAEREENTILSRPDGKEYPEGLIVPEPDTDAAVPEQAIWNSSVPVGSEKTEVRVPDATMQLSGWGISERVGDETNRLKAGDGRTFASIRLSDVSTSSVPTELAFVTNGKSYPLGAPRDGGLSMSLPGDAKDASLAITAAGNTQTVSLTTGEVTSTATAYYDGVELISDDTPLIDQTTDNGSGHTASFQMDDHITWRDSYEEKLGWAPEGKSWLIVDAKWDTSLRYSTGDNYEENTKVTSATIEGLSGEKYTTEALSIDNEKVPDDYRNVDTTRVVFEVPAGIADFRVKLSVNVSGGLEGMWSHEDAPKTASVDDTIDYDAIFQRKINQ